MRLPKSSRCVSVDLEAVRMAARIPGGLGDAGMLVYFSKVRCVSLNRTKPWSGSEAIMSLFEMGTFSDRRSVRDRVCSGSSS